MGKICIKDTGKYGRGIFAECNIKTGEIIEQSPVIVSPTSERDYVDKTIFMEYCFSWGEDYEKLALALGHGSLFNHSYSPNAKFVYNQENLTIDFFALKDIKPGEEITVNYNGEPDDLTPVWFDVID